MKLLLLLLIPILSFSQNIHFDGYVSVDSVSYHVCPARCSAHITSAAATTVTTANEYYFMKGTFHNDNISKFTVDGDTLVYSNGNKRYLFVNYDFDVTASENTTTVTISIYKNNTLVHGSESSTLCKVSGEEYPLGGNFLILVDSGDKIKIMITTNKNTTTATATKGSITAFQIN
jgi:hypothetical protein